MKKLYILLPLFALFLSCEDVIELDLNDAAPRLVIDASIELNADGTTSTVVNLTRSAGFYEEINPIVRDASITVTDSNGQAFNIPYDSNGFYRSDAINVQDNTAYTLTIIDEGNTYTATESLVRTSPLIDVEQETITGFGDDIVKLTAFYNDPTGLGDYYLFEYEDELNLQVDVGDDEFFDGNIAPTIFFIEEMEVGMNALFTVRGIDQRCFQFYETLLEQTDGGGGGPFGTQPATVRGNMINTTNAEMFPFGYFRVSEVFELEYIIQDL